MLIHEGGLYDLLEWFSHSITEHTMVLYISRDKEYRDNIRDLVQKFKVIDDALGEEVHFIVFKPAENGADHKFISARRQGSGASVIGGDYVSGPGRISNEHFGQHGFSRLMQDSIADSTARIINDLQREAQIPDAELPCLVVYVSRMKDPAILPIRSLSTDQIIDKMQRIAAEYRDFARQQSERIRTPRFNIENLVIGLEKKNSKIEKKRKKLIEIITQQHAALCLSAKEAADLLRLLESSDYSANTHCIVHDRISHLRKKNAEQEITIRVLNIVNYMTIQFERISNHSEENLQTAQAILDDRIAALRAYHDRICSMHSDINTRMRLPIFRTEKDAFTILGRIDTCLNLAERVKNCLHWLSSL